MLLLLLLSCFSRVQLCATPQTAAHQDPPSLGFPRQEHWSGLPFPSPMHEKGKVKVKSLIRVRLLATPWTAAHQAPPSMGFSKQEYWSGVPLPSPIISLRLFKFMITELMMPSNHLILWCSLLLLPSVFPSTRVFSNESALCIRWPQCLSTPLLHIYPQS